MISDEKMKNSGFDEDTSESTSNAKEVKESSSEGVENLENQSASDDALKKLKNDDTIRIAPDAFKPVFNSDEIQHMDEIGSPDNFEFDLALAHKNDKQKEAEILEMDRDVQNGDKIDEDSFKSTFYVGELGDEDDIDILPMILKRNSQLQKKYDIEELNKIKKIRKKK